MAKATKFGSGKVKRYNEGGDLEVPEAGTGLKKETFKEAFRRARDRKAPDFEFEGKKYTTEYKEEAAARKAAALAKKPDESAAETARLSRASKTEAKPETATVTTKSPSSREQSEARMAKLADKTLAAAGSEELINLMPAGAALKMAKAAGEKIAAHATRKAPAPFVKREPDLSNPKRVPKDIDEARFADEGNPNFKRGGKIKKMASGGMARSASARADGCAIRGKTRA